MTHGTDGSHWTQHAQRWGHIKPPLRPGAADLAHVRAAIARHYEGRNERGDALLFGVTPELAELRFPPGVKLWAFDQSQPMIDAVWPGDSNARCAKICNWFSLDVADASIGMALGDGCFSTFDYPDGYRRLAASLERVLEPGGLFSIRLFCRPQRAETLDAVFDALFAGEVGNFHAFKWRLAMALQGDDTARGVVLDAIWRAFQARVPDARALAERLAWPLEEVQTIDNYRGVVGAYTYSTVDEVTFALGPSFELLQESRADYVLAERCPQLLFRRR